MIRVVVYGCWILTSNLVGVLCHIQTAITGCIWLFSIRDLSLLRNLMFYCIGCIGNKHDLDMTEKTPMSSSVKDRQRLLSLDEIPHKRHARCQRSSNEPPVKPPVGSPAYATAHQQYEIETAAKLKAEQDRRRQHKQVFQCCSHSLSYCYVCPSVCACSGCCDIAFKTSLSRACPTQASTEQKRQFSLAAEYQSQNVENSKFLRERERVLNLQGSDAGKANQSGDSFDIVTLAYHNSKGGRQLQHMVGSNAAI